MPGTGCVIESPHRWGRIGCSLGPTLNGEGFLAELIYTGRVPTPWIGTAIQLLVLSARFEDLMIPSPNSRLSLRRTHGEMQGRVLRCVDVVILPSSLSLSELRGVWRWTDGIGVRRRVKTAAVSLGGAVGRINVTVEFETIPFSFDRRQPDHNQAHEQYNAPAQIRLVLSDEVRRVHKHTSCKLGCVDAINQSDAETGRCNHTHTKKRVWMGGYLPPF